MAFIRYFSFLSFFSISLLIHAEITIANALPSFHLKAHGDSIKLYNARTLLDSTELRDKILKEYKRLEAYNKANEHAGRSDQNIYVIDPLEDEVYVKILSNNPDDNLSQKPTLKALNERLKEFNNSRQGKDENSGEDKDNTVLFVVACFGLEAYLNSNDAPSEGPSAITKSTSKLNFHFGDDATLNAYFEQDQKEKILGYLGSLLETVKSVNEALSKSGYKNRMIYSYASLTYYTPGLNALDRKKFFYTTTDIQIESDDLPAGRGEYTQTPLKKKGNIIINKARQKKISMKGKTQTAYIREAVEQLILAYQEVMDKDKIALDKNESNCKPPTNCWPMTDDEYKTAMGKFTAKSTSIGQIPNLKVDKIENFEGTQRTKSLTDKEKAFITKQLPDLLTYTDSKYSILIRFAEVNCEIPENERQKFAQDVYKSLGFSDPMIILITVPYYACKEDVYDAGGTTHLEVSALHFMPAAYTVNAELNVKMNAAFRATGDLSDALLNALTPVPKKNTTYVGHVLYTGQIIFSVKEHEDNTATPNRVDIFVFVDDRATKIQPWLNLQIGGMGCEDVFRSAMGRNDGARGVYTMCMKEQMAGISDVLSKEKLKWNMLTSKEGKKYSCELKQSELMKEDGASLAQQFVWAAIHKADLKFYSAGKLGTIDYNGMQDNLFYGENPFHENHWAVETIEKVLDVGGFVASFVGLDFIFDAAGAGFYIIIGDKTNAAIAAGSIIVPAALVTGVKAIKTLKGMRAAQQVSHDVAKALAEGNHVVVNVIAATDGSPVTMAVNLIMMPGGGDRLLVVMGTVMEPAALKILDNNQQVRKALEDSFYIIKDGKVVPNPELPISELSFAKDMANDVQTLELYGQALKTSPNLKFYNFVTDLKKVPYNFHLSPSAAQWARNLKQEPGWVNLVVDGIVDGKIVNNAGEPIPDGAIMDFLIENGYQNGYPEPRDIRIIVRNPAKNQQADLAATRLSKKLKVDAKSHVGDADITAEGLVKMKDGTDMKWVKREGRLPAPDKMFPGAEPVSNVIDGSRTFAFMPYEISMENVVCMVDGKLTVLTPDQIIELFKQKNLRGDASILMGFPNNSYYLDNCEDIELLAKQLQEKLPNKIVYPHKDARVYMTPQGQYRKFLTPEEAKAIDDIPGIVEFIDAKLITLPEKHPLLLFTEKNHTVNSALASAADENKNTLFLVVEEITNDGKVKVFQNNKVSELSPVEFFRTLKSNGVDKKDLSIVAGSGSPKSIQKFAADMAQQTKMEVKAGVADLKAVEDVTTQGINFVKQVPVDDGLYHLRQQITDARLWNTLNKYDENFLNKLGLALEQNNGGYLPRYLPKSVDSKKLAELAELYGKLHKDYTQYGKLSIPTFENIQSISKRLGTDLPDALVKNLYDNPNVAKNLDNQLKWLEPDDVKKLADDPALFDKALDFVRAQTFAGGKGLPYFMAIEKIGEKLPDDIIEAIVERFGNDELFITFLGKEMDKFAHGATLDKFKLYQKNPDFLDEFKALHKSHLENPNRVVDLPLHTLQYQAKNQIVATADHTLKDMADKLAPQEGYMDVFLKVNNTGTGFINEAGEAVSIEKAAAQIRNDPNWDQRPLRIFAICDNPAASTKLPAQDLARELEVIDGSKINPKNDFDVLDGRPKNKMESLASSAPPPQVNAVTRPLSDRTIIETLSLGGPSEDLAVLEAAKRLAGRNSPTKITVVYHTDEDGAIWVLRRGNVDEIEVWMKAEPLDVSREIKTEIAQREARGVVVAEVEIVSCTPVTSLNPVPEIADDLPSRLLVRAPGGGNEFSQIGVGTNGQLLRLSDEPVYAMEFKKGAPPKKGNLIPKSQPADDAIALGWWSRLTKKYDPTATINTNKMERIRRDEKGWVDIVITDDPEYKNLLVSGRWRSSDRVIEISALNEKLLEENLQSIYVAHLVVGYESIVNFDSEVLKGILVKWNPATTPLQWKQYQKQLKALGEANKANAAGRTKVGQALRREGLAASHALPFPHITQIPTDNPDEVVFLFSVEPGGLNGPYR